jgi:hypothetical protein
VFSSLVDWARNGMDEAGRRREESDGRLLIAPSYSALCLLLLSGWLSGCPRDPCGSVRSQQASKRTRKQLVPLRELIKKR